jgi:hypothetical protein
VINDDRNRRDRTATLPELGPDIQHPNALAAERILYDVHYLKTLTETDLVPYPFAVLWRLVYFPAYPGAAELTGELRRLGLRAPVEIEAPRPLLYNVRRKGGRTVVHLLNYGDDRSCPVTLRWQAGAPSSVRLESPDGEAKLTIPGHKLQVSAVKRYTVLVAEGSPPPAMRCF